ncbi:Cys-tRNA(Pro) deacylase [Macrococcoides bohemicum]|uniref:Cys-tRNA(Pro)/Cys-tRNA(Cys) deacylase n=1 Tax=Macrococcoides bohemicum TaxID=1903056 RepID=A0A328A8J0_9STAP|nr:MULTISPECIES: Cys-tRNA(Pro) deacylase [Macrococcus]ATD31373.1 aminoacyl-tRNA deacylase [Macrococcus sp. IME1552]QYA42642.1 Cys-tRNA(Pro) deacylase [Macrococcus bohemicus]RAK49728.1 Cys-tRNA(Pro) deacylase [Macrococcus bohemicus]
MSKKVKTNALRKLDQKKISYETFTYSIEDDQVDGITVANKIGQPVEEVYKTLVLQGKNNYYVAVIPVEATLNIKAISKVVGEKKLEMLAVKDLEKTTGYIRGGCSPVGMKKQFPTVIDASAQSLETIIVSAGQIGIQMKVNVDELVQLINAKVSPITDED